MSAKAKLSCNYLSLIKQCFIVGNHWSQSCIPYMIKIHGIIVLTFYIIIICCVSYGTCCIKPYRLNLVSYNVTCLSAVLTPHTKPPVRRLTAQSRLRDEIQRCPAVGGVRWKSADKNKPFIRYREIHQWNQKILFVVLKLDGQMQYILLLIFRQIKQVI